MFERKCRVEIFIFFSCVDLWGAYVGIMEILLYRNIIKVKDLFIFFGHAWKLFKDFGMCGKIWWELKNEHNNWELSKSSLKKVTIKKTLKKNSNRAIYERKKVTNH